MSWGRTHADKTGTPAGSRARWRPPFEKAAAVVATVATLGTLGTVTLSATAAGRSILSGAAQLVASPDSGGKCTTSGTVSKKNSAKNSGKNSAKNSAKNSGKNSGRGSGRHCH